MPNFDEFDRKVNVAYDLSLFEPQPKEAPKKKNNIIEMPRQRVNQNARRLENFLRVSSAILVVGIIVSLFFSLLMCRVQMTELGDEISATKESLATAQSDYTILEMELKSKTSLKTIEEKSDELGMDKLDKHQIEYFSLTDGDKAEIVEPEKSAGIFSQIADFFTILFGGFVE